MTVLDILRKHETEIKKKFGVSKIGLFGSRARGEQEWLVIKPFVYII